MTKIRYIGSIREVSLEMVGAVKRGEVVEVDEERALFLTKNNPNRWVLVTGRRKLPEKAEDK